MTWQFRKTNGAEPRDICEVHRDVDVVTNLKDSKGLCWLPRNVQPADVPQLGGRLKDTLGADNKPLPLQSSCPPHVWKTTDAASSAPQCAVKVKNLSFNMQ